MNRTGQELATAAAAIGVAFLIRLSLSPWLGGDAAYLLFLVAVLAAALLQGWRAGLMAIALGVGVASLIFLRGSVSGVNATLQTFLFVLSGAAITLICHALVRVGAATEANEQSLSQILETLESGVLVFDRDGFITFANPAAARFFGLTPGHMIGRAHDDAGWGLAAQDGSALPPEQLPVAVTLRTGQGVRALTLTLRAADDSRVPVMVSATPLPASDGAARGVVLSLSDCEAPREERP